MQPPAVLVRIPFVNHALSRWAAAQLAAEGGEMSENIEPANGSASGSSTATAVGAVAPSCYRVSLLSGSLEVSARLKSAEDLELLMKVLEANKALFAKSDRSATEALTLT